MCFKSMVFLTLKCLGEHFKTLPTEVALHEHKSFGYGIGVSLTSINVYMKCITKVTLFFYKNQ